MPVYRFTGISGKLLAEVVASDAAEAKDVLRAHVFGFAQSEVPEGLVPGPFVRWIIPEWPEGKDPLSVPFDVEEAAPSG